MSASSLASRFGPGRLEPLVPDASTRSFFRQFLAQGQTRIVMSDPAGGVAALDRLVAAHALLSSIDVPVPRLYERDDSVAAVVFEDFGDRLLADVLPSLDLAARTAAYIEAARIAARIASRGTAALADSSVLKQPILGASRLSFEMRFLLEHDITNRRGVHDHELHTALDAALQRLVERIAAYPRALAHRDFHARNLMYLADGRLGVVDFQDSLEAPPLYDLASLVRDPYVEPSDQLAAAAAAAYATEAGLNENPLADARFAWVALERDLKAIGTYAYQATQLGRSRFLSCIEPAERLVKKALREIGSEGDELHGLLTAAGFFA